MKQFRSFLAGFGYAAKGIATAVREERNLRFHLCAATYVYVFSAFYAFTRMQYALITMLVCGVIALELVNSAVERAVDKPDETHWIAAGMAKDMAAGAVLVFAAGAAVCGVLLFWDVAAFRRMGAFFISHPIAIVALVASLVAAVWFIFKKGDN